MKKLKEKLSCFFTNGWIIVFLAIILLASLYPIIMMLIGLWRVSNEHLGYFLLNLFSIPFILFGGFNFIRGSISVIEKDEKHFKKYWKFVIYIIATIIGYVALYYAIRFSLKI